MNVRDVVDGFVRSADYDLYRARRGWRIHFPAGEGAHPFNWDMAPITVYGASISMINRHAVDCPDHGGQL